MNKNEAYILERIRLAVWGGYADVEECNQIVEDLAEESDNQKMLRVAAVQEFEKKTLAEKTWPKETDNDRLDAVFKKLNKRRIIALHNAGYELSEGHEEIGEALRQRKQRGEAPAGYCFYHGQDIERAIETNILYLAFGDLKDTVEGKRAIGAVIKQELIEIGFKVNWEDDPEKRILIKDFDWKRRSSR